MKKISIIGVGKMGLSHLAISNSTPNIKVEAICDVSAPLMHFIKKNTNINTYRNYKKMVSEIKPDGVMICTPNAMHFEIAKYCIEKRINVFIEKPLTLNFDESAELCELASKYEVKGQVGYVNRFNPIFKRVKKLLEQNIIGEIISYVNKMVGSVIVKENNKGWRNDYSKGGGCLYDYGPHCFNLSTYFFGTNIKVTSAFLLKVFSTKVDDVVSATLLHNDRIVGYNYVNWSENSVRKASNSIEIIGKKGKIIANKQEANIFLMEGKYDFNLQQGWNQFYVTDECTDTHFYLRGEDFTDQLQSFSDLINGNIKNSISSLEEAKITDKILHDVHRISGGLINNG